MRVLIVGTGVVGLATGRGFARFDHEVMYSDIDTAAYNKLTESERRGIATDEDYKSADLCFICVPEEVAPDVVRRVHELVHDTHTNIVIRSSVPPGTTAKLSEELGRTLWHNPEFLREATSEQDFLWMKHTIIGVSSSTGYKTFPWGLEQAYEGMGIEVIRCHSTESELVKLFTNTYLATLISFWNQAKGFADVLGVNSHTVARLVTLDERVSKYGAYMHGAPYGGRCLPKDIEQMISLAYQLKISPHFLEAVRTENVLVRGT